MPFITLVGTPGDDILNPGWATGTHWMWGGTGNDTYYVNSSDDRAIEFAGNGYDTVVSRAGDFILEANVERLVLDNSLQQVGSFWLPPAARNGAGNDGDNRIDGNMNANILRGLGGNDLISGGSGNDTIDGGTGADTMVGGAGYDTFYVDNAGDRVVGDEFDTVFSSVSFTMEGNLWKLGLTGGALNATGNGAYNSMFGNGLGNVMKGLGGGDYINANGGNDKLYGGQGHDTLYGGSGADGFVFGDKGSVHSDTLTDFSHADDTIVLTDMLDGVFSFGVQGLSFIGGQLSAANYFEGAGLTGNGLSASGIYVDTSAGNIYYNPTSGVVGDSMLLATLTPNSSASLDASDFAYAFA
ncbi:MAG: calcium-binding protein [Micropruina sp.]